VKLTTNFHLAPKLRISGPAYKFTFPIFFHGKDRDKFSVYNWHNAPALFYFRLFLTLPSISVPHKKMLSVSITFSSIRLISWLQVHQIAYWNVIQLQVHQIAYWNVIQFQTLHIPFNIRYNVFWRKISIMVWKVLWKSNKNFSRYKFSVCWKKWIISHYIQWILSTNRY